MIKTGTGSIMDAPESVILLAIAEALEHYVVVALGSSVCLMLSHHKRVLLWHLIHGVGVSWHHIQSMLRTIS